MSHLDVAAELPEHQQALVKLRFHLGRGPAQRSGEAISLNVLTPAHAGGERLGTPAP